MIVDVSVLVSVVLTEDVVTDGTFTDSLTLAITLGISILLAWISTLEVDVEILLVCEFSFSVITGNLQSLSPDMW